MGDWQRLERARVGGPRERRWRRTERLAAESASALRSCGSWFLALGLYIRIVLALRGGRPDEVFALMRQSLVRVREFQDTFAVVYGRVPRAAAAAEKGDDAWVARNLGARHAISERAGATLVDLVRSAVSANGDRHASIRPASPGISKLVHRLVDCGRSERPPGSAKTARLVPSAWTSCSQEAI